MEIPLQRQSIKSIRVICLDNISMMYYSYWHYLELQRWWWLYFPRYKSIYTARSFSNVMPWRSTCYSAGILNVTKRDRLSQALSRNLRRKFVIDARARARRSLPKIVSVLGRDFDVVTRVPFTWNTAVEIPETPIPPRVSSFRYIYYLAWQVARFLRRATHARVSMQHPDNSN